MFLNMVGWNGNMVFSLGNTVSIVLSPSPVAILQDIPRLDISIGILLTFTASHV